MQDAAFVQQRVRVSNPAPVGCDSVEPLDWTIVPPPRLAGLSPSPICVAQSDQTITVSGSRLLAIGEREPALTMNGELIDLTLSDCAAIPTADGDARSCDSLAFTIAQGTREPGTYTLALTNPDPAACVAEATLTLEIVPAPEITGSSPTLLCPADTGAPITLTGQGFVRIDGAAPSVLIDGQSVPASSLDGCTAREGATPSIETCTSLDFTIPEALRVPGVLSFSVQNPAQAACTSPQTRELRIAGPPVIDMVTPGAFCSGQTFDGIVAISGSNMLRVAGMSPSITVNNVAVTGTFADCSPLAGAGGVESCERVTVTVPANLRGGDLSFALSNPAPYDCGLATYDIVAQLTPTITGVSPLRLCDQGGTLVITGTNFVPGRSVQVGPFNTATNVEINAAGTQATATFVSGPGGLYDVTVSNPGGCADTFDTQVRVVAPPQVIFADPPVVYNGINTQVRVFVSGLFGGTITSVSARDSAGHITPLVINSDPNRPSSVQAIIPQGILPAGTMVDDLDLIVVDDVSCGSTADHVIRVTDLLTVAIDKVDPPFGWTNSSTGVTIISKNPAPAGEVQFAATPRVYINPTNAAAGTLATELRSTLFRSNLELGGIIDQGLPVSSYDIIVVNPDGAVGLLPAGFDVLALAPPLVDAVSPGSWRTNNAALAIEVTGQNFRDPIIEATCRDSNGNPQTGVITVVSHTATSIQATVNTNTLSHLAVCFIRVTNTDDGSYVEYSPITVTNPAGNFVSFQPGPDMASARRSLASASGVPSRAQTYVYAIGGDAGAPANAIASVEASGLDRFGAPTPWFTLKTALPTGRALAQDEAGSAEASSTEAASQDAPVFTVAPHIGVTIPQLFSDLGSWPIFGLELGFLVPFDVGNTVRPLQLSLGAHYTAPGTTGEGTAATLGESGAAYSWELQQRMLMWEFLVSWRLNSVGSDWNVYGFIGPRLYLMESVLTAQSQGLDFGENRETGSAFGVGGGAGGEYQLGPGALLLDLRLSGSDLNQTITGDSSTGAMALSLGYRLFL